MRRPDFRLFAGAQLLGSTGVWMLRMAMDWLVLELTDSPAAVGVLVALQFLPMLVVGPLAGVLVDRHDRRRLVLAAQAASVLIAVVLAALTLGDVVLLWHVYALATVLGVVGAIDTPGRQVLVNEVVGDGRLRSAISLTNAISQGGGLVGPAVAGFVIAEVGEGWSFGLNAVVGLCVVALLLAIRPHRLHVVPRLPRGPGQVREGFRYVAARSHLLAVVGLAGLMGAFGLNGPVVWTAFADGVWATGAWGFGLYNSVAAVGAVAGALLASRARSLRVRGVVLAAALFGVAETVVAVMPTHATFLVAVAAVGVTTLLFLSSAITWVQLTADAHVRGRVLAIYSPVLLGGHALGGLVQGALVEHLGVRGGLVATGGLALVSTGTVAAFLRRELRRRPAVPPSTPLASTAHPAPSDLVPTPAHRPDSTARQPDSTTGGTP
nr:MFS transporter [Cellulomonas sp. APG4]